jgi:hypothetical protein
VKQKVDLKEKRLRRKINGKFIDLNSADEIEKK